jgi:hypothetical protein
MNQESGIVKDKSGENRSDTHHEGATQQENGGSDPRVVTRGSDCHFEAKGVVGVDWLTGSVRVEHLETVTRRLKSLFGRMPERVKRGMHGYDERLEWPEQGGRILVDSSLQRCEDHHAGRVTVQIEGEGCGRIGRDELLSLMRLMQRCRVKWTRVDVYYDDFRRRKDPREIFEAIDNGEGELPNVIGIRKHAIYHKWDMGKTSGYTLNLGGRESEKYVRIYDKKLESKGERDCVRYEVECKGFAAQVLGAVLAEAEDGEAFARVAGEYVGAIGFCRRPGKDRHRSRMKVFSWWKGIRDEIGCAVWAKKQGMIRSIGKAKKWAERQVATSLAMIQGAVGVAEFDRWMCDLLVKGTRRLSPVHMRQIEQYEEDVGWSIDF